MLEAGGVDPPELRVRLADREHVAAVAVEARTGPAPSMKSSMRASATASPRSVPLSMIHCPPAVLTPVAGKAPTSAGAAYDHAEADGSESWSLTTTRQRRSAPTPALVLQLTRKWSRTTQSTASYSSPVTGP